MHRRSPLLFAGDELTKTFVASANSGGAVVNAVCALLADHASLVAYLHKRMVREKLVASFEDKIGLYFLAAALNQHQRETQMMFFYSLPQLT